MQNLKLYFLLHINKNVAFFFYSSASEFVTWPYRTVSNRTVIFLLERIVYRTVPFSIFFRKARSQPLKTLNISDFWLKKREPYRTVTKTKAFSIFNFNRDSYRTETWSVYRYFNDKNGNMDVFWLGTVRVFCKKSKNGTVRGIKF